MGKSNQHQQQQLVHTSWHGPIPSPADLEQFKRLVPNAPERILCMAEEEARVRRDQFQRDHDSENRVKEADVKLYHAGVMRGQIFAAIVLLAIVAAIIVCAVYGHGGAAAAVAGMGAAGIVSNFIVKRK